MEKRKSVAVPCEVCGGKGGWYYENSYYDCPLCEGFGFREKDLEEDALSLQFMVQIGHFRDAITEQLELMGNVVSFFSDDSSGALKITFEFRPDSPSEWSQIAKRLLKMTHFHSGLEILVNQRYYYDSKEKKYRNSWVIEIMPDDLRDLEAIVLVLTDWNHGRDNSYEKYDKKDG